MRRFLLALALLTFAGIVGCDEAEIERPRAQPPTSADVAPGPSTSQKSDDKELVAVEQEAEVPLDAKSIWLEKTAPDDPVAISALEALRCDLVKYNRRGVSDNVVTVRLSSPQLTDDDLRHLTGLPALEEVDVTKTSDSFTGDGFAHLQDVKRLWRLDYWGESGKSIQVDDIAKLRRLEELRCNRIDDAALEKLAQLKLHRFSTSDSQISKVGLAHIAKITGLEELGIFGPGDYAADVAALLPLTNLQMLCLEAPLNDAALAELVKLPQLTSLNVRGQDITDAGVKRIAALKNLQRLTLDGTACTDAGLASLKACTKLEELALVRSQQITGQGLADLRELKLRILTLNHSKISDEGLRHVGACCKPGGSLNIGGVLITDKGLAALASASQLASIYGDSPNVTQQGINDLQKALPNCRVDISITAP